MRLFGNSWIALTVMAAALAAGCAAGSATSAFGPASARPQAAAANTAGGTFPAVFAASFPFTAAEVRDSGQRIALLSSRTGHLLRWLTPRQDGVNDAVLSVHDGWVYFLRNAGNAPGATWRVRVTGGPAQLVQAGSSDSAVSPDGRVVAYVTSTDHGDVLEIVARNLVTGRRNTIIVATKPSPGANNWPPNIFGLTWAPDDAHLAVTFEPTAAINSVLVFDAFTARTAGDGRIAPPSCPVSDGYTCGESDPAYLASGALTYVVQRVYAPSGVTSESLVAWQAGRLTTLLSFPARAPMPGVYDMTPQEQTIWVDGPAQPKGPWEIWRWSGGTPVKITTLPPLGASPYYGVSSIAW